MAQKLQDSKVLRKEVLELLLLVEKDKLKLENVSAIYPKLRKLFFFNQEYFHILPQLFSQHYCQAVTSETDTTVVQHHLS